MLNRRIDRYRLLFAVVGVITIVALTGCPPPRPATSPGEAPAVSQHTLDSLRADSLNRCRMHSSFAYQYARSGLRKDAITQFQKALRYGPGNLEVERYYAQYLSEWGMKDSAFAHYQHIAKLDTTNVDAHFWLYQYYHDTGNYGASTSELLAAARHQDDPKTRELWFRTAGDMLVADNRQPEACDIYSYLWKAYPGDSTVATKLLAYCSGADQAKRLSILREACAANTQNESLCLKYAEVADSIGNSDSSLAVFLRFAAVDSNNVTLWDSVLRSARAVGRTDVSMRALRKLVQLQPNDPERTAALADALFSAGRYTEMFNLLEPVLRRNPCNAHLLYLAGLYYSRDSSDAGKRKALEYLDRAVLTNDPTWKSVALGLHDEIEPPLTEEQINQAVFFGKPVKRLHYCLIPGRAEQNKVPGVPPPPKNVPKCQ